MATATSVCSGEFQWHGHRLAYELYGSSGVPCVLIHGILLDSVLNRSLARRLVGEGFRVALLDLLGHGHSEHSTRVGDHRADSYGEQVVALLDHLGWPKALVGGLSLGAMTSLHVAALAPERVLGLFLEMPVMESSTPPAALLLVPPMLAARYGAWLWRRVAHWLRRLPRPEAEWLVSVLNGFSAEPETVAAILHGVFVGPVVPTVAARRAIRAPTLVIGHGGDLLHELRDARRLAEQIPGAHLLRSRSILELRTHPERLWPQIHTFLVNEVLPAAQGGRAAQGTTPRPAKGTSRRTDSSHPRKSKP
ncbi:MAG TPA: alpha/beta fold hydrolase [Nevskiaceae bacterium]|nr:alpha/beta fold hydrolase [Nevskiaceae bacterium]